MNNIPDKFNTTADISRLFALTRNIEQWAGARNLIEGSDTKNQMLKLTEEVGEIAAAIARGNAAGVIDGIGDVYVVITIMCKQLGIELEDAAEAAWHEIKDRTGRMCDGVWIKNENKE